jgi:hypothetical protein
MIKFRWANDEEGFVTEDGEEIPVQFAGMGGSKYAEIYMVFIEAWDHLPLKVQLVMIESGRGQRMWGVRADGENAFTVFHLGESDLEHEHILPVYSTFDFALKRLEEVQRSLSPTKYELMRARRPRSELETIRPG